MIRLLIAVSALSLLTAPFASAEDYPPCRHPGDDHCRVVAGYGGGHHRHMGRHHKGHRHHMMAHHRHHHAGHQHK
ncbi:MAG TPA: hypothetical protein VFE03_14900 [Caulobacteraceae bacterium]|nr:hypothetical protein [Caulobacteraceae bacterium]